MVDFGNKLKTLREKKGLSQKQLGLQLGLTKSTISAYENGLRKPSYDVLIVIADIFNVTTDYLLGVKSKGNTIDLSGLSDSQAATVKAVVDSMRE